MKSSAALSKIHFDHFKISKVGCPFPKIVVSNCIILSHSEFKNATPGPAWTSTFVSKFESFPSGDGFLSGCKSLAFFLYAFLISFSVALIETPNTKKIDKIF